jgi:small-conductance mechanosensitive channel
MGIFGRMGSDRGHCAAYDRFFQTQKMDLTPKGNKKMAKHSKFKGKYVCGLLLSLLLVVRTVPAQTETEKEKLKKASDYSTVELSQSIKNTVAAETTSLEEIKKRLGRLDILKKAVVIEINAYNIQNSTHSNLLLQAATPVTVLEKAFGENRLALNTIEDKIKDFNKRRDSANELFQQTQNQISLSAKQAAEIKSSGWAKSEKASLLGALQQLDRILTEKQGALQHLHEGLEPLIKQLETARISTSQLNGKLEQQVKTRKARELFGRKYLLLKAFKKDAVAKEFAELAANLAKPFQKDFFQSEDQRIRETAAMSLLILIFLTAIAAALVIRLRRYCSNYEKRPFVPTHRWRFLCVRLIRRSLFLFGILLILTCYNIIQFAHYRFPLHNPVFNILLIFLFSRWVLDFFKFRQTGEDLFIPQELGSKIQRVTIWMRYVAVAYVVIYWAVGEDSIILFTGRLGIEIFLITWCVTFWKASRMVNRPHVQDLSAPKVISYPSLIILTYLVPLGALVIELAGYPTMALYWLMSWGRSLAALFWGAILFHVIIEWRTDYQPSDDIKDTEPLPTVYPIQRLFVSVAWLVWFLGGVAALVLAWSTRQNVFTVIYATLSKSFPIGNINLSLLGLLFAVLILFLTLILTRLGSYILSEKIFAESDLEPGLQDSITTISTYVLWGLAVILALSVLGVSTTSLTVVFGALGIGLGFGLQAIFNNFVSGIILLFERPIQVGDAVQIQGVWGTVKKINVRATVVQTFDNASLIIPNSEFISSQVTNWSFKESSLRRKVNVGVAYGSDTELVRKTLLEIANQTKNVLKKPKPDVIFDDHGDSALIFTLRYWTTVDYYYPTYSDIRFAIDRLFKERDIEIAFPQRDIHIRSILKDQEQLEASKEEEKTSDNREAEGETTKQRHQA